MNEYSTEQLQDLVKRAATNAIWRYQSKRPKRPAWVAIKDHFGLGSTKAAELCNRLGFDSETGEPLT